MSKAATGSLIIRADAGSRIGTGHLMRCLALAQAWQDGGGRAILLSAECPPALNRRLEAERVTVIHATTEPGSGADAVETADRARRENANWVVADGYHFDAVYQAAIKQAGLGLLFVDDWGHADSYCADIVLNQNIYAGPELYERRCETTRLLLGTEYALLRREFLQQLRRRETGEARNLLVTLGGSDPGNITRMVVDSLSAVAQDVDVRVLVGASNARGDELCEAARQCRHPVRVERDVTDMPGVMAWADVAVSGAGSTCWELAFMGLPAALVVLAENQRLIAEGLASAGFAVNLGEAESLTPQDIAGSLSELVSEREQLARMSAAGRELVDGLGARRVVEAICTEVA